MKALILAAGEGTRLQPLTAEMPKPMLPVVGRPLLEHTIEALARQGIVDLAINLHHRPEAITEHFGDGSALGVNIIYSHERQLLGTAGAAKAPYRHRNCWLRPRSMVAILVSHRRPPSR